MCFDYSYKIVAYANKTVGYVIFTKCYFGRVRKKAEKH